MTPSDSLGQPDNLEVIIDAFVEDYEMLGETEDGRDACHIPTEGERALIKDAICGLLADTDWDNAWGDHIRSIAHSRKDAEPVGWMRLWHFSGETPTKHRNANGRLAWPAKFKFMPVTPSKIFDDDVPVFTHPPEADKLLQQALEAVLDEHLPGFTEDAPRQHDDVIYDKAIEDAADAIQQLIARTYLENKNA